MSDNTTILFMFLIIGLPFIGLIIYIAIETVARHRERMKILSDPKLGPEYIKQLHELKMLRLNKQDYNEYNLA